VGLGELAAIELRIKRSLEGRVAVGDGQTTRYGRRLEAEHVEETKCTTLTVMQGQSTSFRRVKKIDSQSCRCVNDSQVGDIIGRCGTVHGGYSKGQERGSSKEDEGGETHSCE
jgi:hypothetical protein